MRRKTDASLEELLHPAPDDDDTAVIERVDPADPADSLLDDDDFLPQERQRPARLTAALIVALVLAVGVLGDVWVQKQLGGSAAASGFPSGAPAGLPGGQRPPGGAGLPGAGPSGDSQPDGSGSSDGADTPVVVGTVTTINGKRLIVTDLGDHKHQVTVATDTTLTTPYAHGALKRGDTVSIVGTESGDDVTASAITVRWMRSPQTSIPKGHP